MPAGARARPAALDTGRQTFAPGYHLVSFRAPAGRAERAWLDALTGAPRRADGTSLARWYLPDDSWCVWVADEATLAALRARATVACVVPYGWRLKLDPTLRDLARGREATLEVELVPGHDAVHLAQELTRAGGRVLEHVELRGRREHDLSFFLLAARPARVPALARLEGVRRLAPHEPDGLDGASLSALVAAARAPLRRVEVRPTARYDARAALLDLLAHEDPTLLVAAPATSAGAWPKNVLPLAGRGDEETPDGELLAPLAGARPPSAALRRALRVHQELGLESTLTSVLDVAPADGFDGADAPARLHRFRALPGALPALTLAWTDAPALAGSEPTLVDDLDLVVTAPDGTCHRRRCVGAAGGVTGVVSEPWLAAEHFVAAQAAEGTWTVAVEPAHGAFAAPLGYALVASGLVEERVGASLALEVPSTAVLRPTAAWNSKDGALAAANLDLLARGDDQRYVLRDRQALHVAFGPPLPPGALVSAVRVLVEHHELPRVLAGDIRWRLGSGVLSAPSMVAELVAPLRAGPAAEGLDGWSPTSFPLDAGALVLQLENASQSDDTLLDQVYLEVDYLGGGAPLITSTPNPGAALGQAYQYDTDGRAQATSASAVSWSLVRAPVGLAVQAATGLVTWTPSSTGAFGVTLRATNASGFAEQSFTITVTSGPGLPSTLLPVNATPLVYVPPERLALGPARSQQRLNVFLPPGVPPVGGWPVVLNNRAGGGLAALPLGSLSDTGASAPLHAFVASGIAVVDHGVMGIGAGQGLFYPPGHASGRYESFRPSDDNPEKDIEWALQWLGTQTSYPLARSRVCLRGSSQGAILALWCGFGPERARASGSAQVRASTRVAGVLALQPPTSNWAFDQDPTFASRMIEHYEQAAAPGVPATFFAQVAESLQKAGSVMGFAFASAEARARNELQPVCLIYAEPVLRVGGAPADFTLDAAGYPRLRDALVQTFVHDSWAGYVLFRRLLDLSPGAAAFHRANSLFAVRDTSALPAPFAWHTHTYAGLLTGAPATALAHAWVCRTLGVAAR